MSDAGPGADGCLFHGYARWYAAVAGALIPLSNLPIVEAAEVEGDTVGRREWGLTDLAGGLAEVIALLVTGLFLLLVVTSIRPAPRSGRRVVVVALLAAVLAVLAVTTPSTDGSLTGWGQVAAAILVITAGLAADHALHLIRYRKRERLESAGEPTKG